MKKSIVVMGLVLAALAVFSTSVAFAQTPQPFNGTGNGPLHPYMVEALAQALGITPAEFEAQRAAGKTAYQIALDLGVSADKIPALISAARTQALDAAFKAGAITQQQAGWMKSRGSGMGSGNCNGTGTGPGMGRGGGRFQQTSP